MSQDKGIRMPWVLPPPLFVRKANELLAWTSLCILIHLLAGCKMGASSTRFGAPDNCFGGGMDLLEMLQHKSWVAGEE
eukprot:1134201-Pelagomonas_calceolata.AAC.1